MAEPPLPGNQGWKAICPSRLDKAAISERLKEFHAVCEEQRISGKKCRTVWGKASRPCIGKRIIDGCMHIFVQPVRVQRSRGQKIGNNDPLRLIGGFRHCERGRAPPSRIFSIGIGRVRICEPIFRKITRIFISQAFCSSSLVTLWRIMSGFVYFILMLQLSRAFREYQFA